MKLNEFIKQLRKQLGLTQNGLGALIGKDRSTVAKYELGLTVPPGNVLLELQALDPKRAPESTTVR